MAPRLRIPAAALLSTLAVPLASISAIPHHLQRRSAISSGSWGATPEHPAAPDGVQLGATAFRASPGGAACKHRAYVPLFAPGSGHTEPAGRTPPQAFERIGHPRAKPRRSNSPISAALLHRHSARSSTPDATLAWGQSAHRRRLAPQPAPIRNRIVVGSPEHAQWCLHVSVLLPYHCGAPTTRAAGKPASDDPRVTTRPVARTRRLVCMASIILHCVGADLACLGCWPQRAAGVSGLPPAASTDRTIPIAPQLH